MSDINPQGTELTPLIVRHTEASHNEPPPRTHADGVIQPRCGNEVKDAPVDSVDGVIERDEVIAPGVGDTYIVTNQPLALQMPRNERKKGRRSRDETDSELIMVEELVNEDEKEPSCSFSPSETEEMEDAPLNVDEGVVQPCCFPLRSSYLRKKCEVLFYAVDYKPETVEEILGREESSTLIELFTKPDINGLPCIMKAISRQSLPCIEPLLKTLQKLDFSSHNIDKMDALQTHNKENIFHIAAQMVKKEEIINIMCNYRMMDELADRPDSNGRTPLIVACQHQNHLMARKLVLEKKAKIDHVDNDKKSPIYLATITGSVQMLKYFLEKGERDTRDQLELFKKCELYHDDGTILQAIVESRCPGTLKVCLDVDNWREHIVQCLEQERESSRTFIHTVCQTPLVELVKLAIEGTEQVLEILDDDYATPLIKAVKARQLEIVKLILSTKTGQKTISFQTKSTEETALMIACQKGFHKIVQLIMEISNIDIDLGRCDTNRRNVFHHAAKDDAILSVMVDICRRREEKYQNYKCFLTKEDKNGYAPLHYAASHGACKNVTLLLENNVPYNTLSARVERTALHYASCSNIDTVSALLEYVEKHFSKDELKNFIDKGDCRLHTSLHIAAQLGKWETAWLLLEKGATIKFDKDNETPLHMACNAGCIKTVELLIQHDQTVINSENRVGETPAMFAAVSGQTETLEILLAKNAKLWAESHCRRAGERKTCLDWAVLGGKPETVKAILEHPTWMETMKKSFFGADGLLGKMVVSMPSVAIEVLNKCARETKKAHEIELEYDFFALQTTESSCGKESDRHNLSRSKKVTDMKALEAMVNYSRNECLSHPVVEKFLQQKWSLRTRFCYIFCLMIYTLFLISFTAYITLVTEGRSDHSCSIIKMICYVLAIMSVVKELFQLYHRRLQYFCMESTYLELVMYICVFVYLPHDEKSNVQRQAGAVAIFLGWINFTWFLKRFQTYGIYIIMAKKIFVTFIKVFVPVSFFIIAFSMTFFVLFHDTSEQHGFDNIVRSFVTAFAMMAGDMDYRETFLGQDGRPNFVLMMLFVVLFLALMSILLMNLLTGLAVGDIGMIMRRSIAEKQIQQAKLIVEMDTCLKTYPGLGAKYIEPLTVQHKRNSCYKTCLQKLKKKLFPSLDMDDDTERKKQQECEIVKIKRQLNVVQNTLEEIQRSLKKNQPTTLNKRERAFSLVPFARKRLGTL